MLAGHFNGPKQFVLRAARSCAKAVLARTRGECGRWQKCYSALEESTEKRWGRAATVVVMREVRLVVSLLLITSIYPSIPYFSKHGQSEALLWMRNARYVPTGHLLTLCSSSSIFVSRFLQFYTMAAITLGMLTGKRLSHAPLVVLTCHLAELFFAAPSLAPHFFFCLSRAAANNPSSWAPRRTLWVSDRSAKSVAGTSW